MLTMTPLTVVTLLAILKMAIWNVVFTSVNNLGQDNGESQELITLFWRHSEFIHSFLKQFEHMLDMRHHAILKFRQHSDKQGAFVGYMYLICRHVVRIKCSEL